MVPIKWLFNQFDRKYSYQKCSTPMRSGISCRTTTFWEKEKKKKRIFSWKMISLKTELFGLITDIFLFISSRIWSRFSPSP